MNDENEQEEWVDTPESPEKTDEEVRKFLTGLPTPVIEKIIFLRTVFRDTIKEYGTDPHKLFSAITEKLESLKKHELLKEGEVTQFNAKGVSINTKFPDPENFNKQFNLDIFYEIIRKKDGTITLIDAYDRAMEAVC